MYVGGRQIHGDFCDSCRWHLATDQRPLDGSVTQPIGRLSNENGRARGARELVGRMRYLSLLALIGMALLLVYGLIGWLVG